VTKTWDLASGWVRSVLHNDTRARTNVAYAPASENSNQAQTQEAAASQTAPVAQPAPETPQPAPVAQPTLGAAVAQSAQARAALGISPELQQKFESLQDDIADVRRIVEQIAIRQEQMTESVVALQAAQQTLTQKLSLPQTAAASAVSHARKSTYPEAAAVPRPIPAPPPRLEPLQTSH